MDLYGQQIGSRLEDMSSFAKYLGGSSCNIAYGTARLGLNSTMLTRVGNEYMGRFVREELARAKASKTSYLITLDTDPYSTADGGFWWDVAVPEVSEREQVQTQHKQYLDGKKKQPY